MMIDKDDEDDEDGVSVAILAQAILAQAVSVQGISPSLLLYLSSRPVACGRSVPRTVP